MNALAVTRWRVTSPTNPYSPRCCRIIALMVSLALTAVAWSHPPVSTAALVSITREGQVTITVVHDALAFALNDTSMRISDRDMFALFDGPEPEIAAAFADGRERFAGGFRLAADGTDVPFDIAQAPDLASLHQWKAEHSGRNLPCKLEFVVKATLPAAAHNVTLQFPDIFADTLIVVTRPGVEPFSIPLAAGEESPAIEVDVVGPPAPTASAAANATQPTTNIATDAPAEPARKPVASMNPFSVAWRFIKLGFEHIIPQGPDHCLFVLGLFLLSPRIKPVLWQISAFTLAHTLTLTLTSLHIIGLPSSIVEPTIAASVAFIGIENLCTTSVHRWRYVVAFVFGLVHGMGVATAFNEAGFPPGQLVASLASFTVGVEAGHIAVLAAAFAALGWTRNRKWYRPRIEIPLSLAIAAIGLLWMVQRIVANV